jgi:hypothetical protein
MSARDCTGMPICLQRRLRETLEAAGMRKWGALIDPTTNGKAAGQRLPPVSGALWNMDSPHGQRRYLLPSPTEPRHHCLRKSKSRLCGQDFAAKPHAQSWHKSIRFIEGSSLSFSSTLFSGMAPEETNLGRSTGTDQEPISRLSR